MRMLATSSSSGASSPGTPQTAPPGPAAKKKEKKKKRGRGSIGTSTPLKGLAFSWVAVCTAEVVTCPIDVCKVRLQLEGELGAARRYDNIFDAMRKIARGEGAGALWKGVGPALGRQTVYGTLRYGGYEPIKKWFGVDASGDCEMWKKIAASAVSSGGSSFLANPFNMVKIRMQADTSVDAAARRHSGLVCALRDIVRSEGFFKLWRGAGPTVTRAMVGGMSELPVYDEIKNQLVGREILTDGLPLHLTCSLSAGLFSCFCMNPFDVAKSRIMNQRAGKGGAALQYTGMLDCFAKSVRAEGVLCLWKGFFPSYARIGPRVVIIFLMLEELRKRFD